MDYDPNNQNKLGAVIYIASDVEMDQNGEVIGGAGVNYYYYKAGTEVEPKVGKLNYAEGAYFDLSTFKREDAEDADDTDLEEEENGEAVVKKKVKLTKPKGKVVECFDEYDCCQTYLSKDRIVTKQTIALAVMEYVLSTCYKQYFKKVTIIEQGGAVSKLLSQFAPVYEKNNWKLQDGGEIPYVDLIQKAYDTYKKVKEDSPIIFSPIPANVSEYGIDIAIANSKKAIFAGMSGKPLNEFYTASIREIGPRKLPKIDKHPFIQLKQVLFRKNELREDGNRFRYHFMSLPRVNAGIKKENSNGVVKQARKDYFNYIGKTDTETIYQICDFKDPIKPIDAISTQLINHDKTCYNKIFLGIISEIYGTSCYFDLSKYGGFVFETKGSYSSRLVMKTPDGKIIGNEVSPPRRVKDALFVIGQLSELLNNYYKGFSDDSVYTLTDVTHYFYKLPDADSKKTKVTLVPDFTNNVKKINMQVGYHNQGKQTDLVYSFQIGYDLPPRNLFLNVASIDTKVSIITWPEVGLGARYAVIVDTKDDTCIWSNWYSNVILIKGT